MLLSMRLIRALALSAVHVLVFAQLVQSLRANYNDIITRRRAVSLRDSSFYCGKEGPTRQCGRMPYHPPIRRDPLILQLLHLPPYASYPFSSFLFLSWQTGNVCSLSFHGWQHPAFGTAPHRHPPAPGRDNSSL